MQYPDSLRHFVGMIPFGLGIDGKRKQDMLRVFDIVFSPSGIQKVRMLGDEWLVDTTEINERAVHYFAYNMLRYARRSPLYAVLNQVFSTTSGSVFVDVGANLGIYSMLARELGAQAILFEPEPDHAAWLTRNKALVGRVFPIALSNWSGSAPFYVGDARHSGASSLCNGTGQTINEIYGASVEVTVDTFDSFAASHDLDLDSIRLIKIDVEGNEVATLRGMASYLSRSDAAPVWCEVRGPESDRGRDSYLEAIAFVGQLGYRPYTVQSNTVQRQALRPFDPRRDIRQVFDLLFLSPERHASLRPIS